MFQINSWKRWLDWRLVRAHLCTLAVCVGHSSTWRVPREGARLGGLQYALALTVAMLAVALPLVLLQLAIGQLSQQDAVGVWRAVPFFKGVGYIRLLVSFLGAIYTAIYVSLTVAYFLYTLSNSIPFGECTNYELIEAWLLIILGVNAWSLRPLVEASLPAVKFNVQYPNRSGITNLINATECLNETFMAPVKEKPEYYIALSLIILFIWIALPFLPVKMMKRVFYIFGPVVVLLGVVVSAAVGSGGRLAWFVKTEDWQNFLQPHIWFGAITQALLSTEVAGGYLISAGDSIYSNNNVQWTALILVFANILASWLGLAFWFGVSGGEEMSASPAAVLALMYRAAEEDSLPDVWSLLVHAALFCSGVITMLVRLYPLYERMRRSCGARWRVISACGSVVGAAGSLVTLALRLPALLLLEDHAVPLLISLATVLEILAFVFIYGWKVLKEDVEFLIGENLKRYWVLGWCAAPGVVAPFAVWWAVVETRSPWSQPPFAGPTVVAASTTTFLVVVILAACAVARQVQYDIIGKLKSSFQPSRHWGPRDPITHHYWRAQRDEAGHGLPGAPAHRFRRRQPGQLSGSPSFLNLSSTASIVDDLGTDQATRRCNSDDLVYTIYRKKYLEIVFPGYLARVKQTRSKSFEHARKTKVTKKVSIDMDIFNVSDFVKSVESIEHEKYDSKPNC